MSLAINLTLASIDACEHSLTASEELPLPVSQSYTGRGMGRFLAQGKPKASVTCDKYPRICRAKGSGGPDCCNKQCVDVQMDRLNCGVCGNKCKYAETCCEGHCVNLSYNDKHCGKCSHSCSKKGSCAYGLCSYA
ncbi:stigma-specific STIG1-like protein 1 [Cinnamomum micranthum f. kanehirae]|uniref:Stigma-specific STIG1-like protein 1 n=1 Tax=Cinnamomum micranthum f. kanehirae TaxID=337451 RepID=A0A443PZF3_9MAGN|nr:stigma-specific STIG1-like protein 1 [Cinnamomum micranthum f. kanehirae]